jgi:predicted  nucleic acid-binding Zn-ribbon protein
MEANTQKLPHEIKQEIDNFRASLNRYLNDIEQESRKEVQYVSKALDQVITAFEESINKLSEELSLQIKELENENLGLKKVPNNLSAKLSELAPIICMDIQANLTKNLQFAINDTEAKVAELRENIIETINKIQGFKNSITKKLALFFTGTILASSLVSGLITYYITENLPRKFIINSTGNITIDDSQVSVWGKEIGKNFNNSKNPK